MPTLQKKVIAAFIRSGCKRRLRLSLYPSDKEREAVGMPETQKARAGLGIAGQLGYKWQDEKVAELVEVFGESSVQQDKRGTTQKAEPQELRDLIDKGLVTPYKFIVEARYAADTPAFRQGMGLVDMVDENGEVLDMRYNHADLIQILPSCANAAPDERVEYSQQVNPDGTTTLLAATDTRTRLRIIDIKLAAEPGAHYFAEVVYYALTLAGWLDQEKLTNDFVVVAASAVWPGSYEASEVMLAKKKLISTGSPVTLAALTDGLEKDLEIAPFEIFVARLRRFFSDTLPEVLLTPWQQLPWHVDYNCSGCEFLGYPWPLKDGSWDFNTLWCWPEARRLGHASRIVGLSRGNRQQLGAPTVAQIAQFTPDNDLFKKSSSLRSQQHRFPKRAEALITDTSFIIPDSGSDALMPRLPALHIYIFLDYDLSSAITVTFGIRAFWLEPTPFGSAPEGGSKKKIWNAKQGETEIFVVESRDLAREQAEFLKFLRSINSLLAEVRRFDDADIQAGRRTDGFNRDIRSTYQIFLWDEAQRKHLQRVASRHLAAILADPQLQSLIWLFPPPEILSNPEGASIRSPFTLVGRVIENTAAINLAHHYTVFGVAQCFHPPEYTPPALFTLYQDPLSDLIPAERIHELWTKRGTWTLTLDGIKEATQKKLMALGAIVTQLERELGKGLLPNRLAAPIVAERAPRTLTGLPPLSLLLHEFVRLNGALQDLDSFATRAMPAYEREARFKSAYLPSRLHGEARNQAIALLTRVSGRDLTGPDLLVYQLAEESKNVNLRPGDIGYALSPRNRPDFLLQEPHTFVRPDHKLEGYVPKNVATIADLSLTGVTIEAIDRQQGLIALRPDASAYLTRRDDPERGAARTPYTLEEAGLIDLSSEVMLDPVEKDFLAKKVELTLRGINYPELAFLNDNATMRVALNLPPVQRPTNFSAITPAANFLWDGANMATTPVVRDLATVRPVLESLLQTKKRNLNGSQWEAWTAALSRRLSLIWGPPGTGKSQTLISLIAGALLDAHQRGVPLRLLLTANNYAAIDNVLYKLPDFVAELMPGVPVSFVRLLGRTKEAPTDLPAAIQSLHPRSTEASTETQELWAQLNNPTGLTIVAGIPHQVHNLAVSTHKKTAPSAIIKAQSTQRRWFDLIVVDEASQMDVAYATLIISKADDEGSFVLAGDDLQLPPIHVADAPQNLEHHVGSVFGYVRNISNIQPLPLNTNYRSNATLVAFTRTAGYDTRLTAHSPNLCLDLTTLPTVEPPGWPAQIPWSPDWIKLLDPNFSGTAYTHADDTSGQSNEFEAAAVVALVSLLRNRLRRQLLGELQPDGTAVPASSELFDPATDFWTKAVGIVTPHRAQMSRIVTSLQHAFPTDDPEKIRAAVDTVERFQGQERAVIIASFGIGDPDLIRTEDEFLYSLRRFNVLASRARAKLIVLASQSLIDYLPNDAEILEESRLLKRFVETFCQPAGALALPYLTDSGIINQQGYLAQR